MTSYLDRLDATPADARWPLVRRWMFEEPLPFYAELLRYRPVLKLPELTLVARHADCVEVLQRHDLFSVKLYEPKQGQYWMAQDDTPQHCREKAIMQSILDREDVAVMRAWVAGEAAERLRAAGGELDLVEGLTRAVPVALVQRWFGLTDSDAAELERWSYWNQQDCFWNQPFDAHVVSDPAAITTNREQANEAMRTYLGGLLQRRGQVLAQGATTDDPVCRLLRLSGSNAVRLDAAGVALNAGGLLIGAVETTSHAAVNALEVILEEPARAEQARAAARSNEPSAVDGFVLEALRFKPAFPYFFRTAEVDCVLARNTDYATRVPAGTTVLALTHAAMHDSAAVDDPATFDADRGYAGFLFGLGIHQCLGRAIGGVMIPEIVRQALRLEGVEPGSIDRPTSAVPESWPWRWQSA